MSVPASSSSSIGAIAGGVRHELKAMVMRRALEDAGVLDENLARGFDAVEALARSTTRAGVEALRADTVGALIDVLA